jgi:uncharacterized membrane protein YtjA (UPF0391 family)
MGNALHTRPASPQNWPANDTAQFLLFGWLLLGCSSEEGAMLYYALIFLVVALIAGALGVSGVASVATNIAYILFVIAVVLFVVHLVAGRRTLAR